MRNRKKVQERIEKALQQNPADALNFGRTALANERTFLAFIRTTISLMASGIGLILLLKHPLMKTIGWIFIGFAIFVLIWGLYRYFFIKKLLVKEFPDNLE